MALISDSTASSAPAPLDCPTWQRVQRRWRDAAAFESIVSYKTGERSVKWVLPPLKKGPANLEPHEETYRDSPMIKTKERERGVDLGTADSYNQFRYEMRYKADLDAMDEAMEEMDQEEFEANPVSDRPHLFPFLKTVCISGHTDLRRFKLGVCEAHVVCCEHGWTQLPEALKDIGSITSLQAVDHQLTQVPPFLNSKQLKRLHLDGNKIKELPHWLPDMELEELTLLRNPITSYAILSQCSTLKLLEFSVDDMSEIPQNLAHLTQLELLNIYIGVEPETHDPTKAEADRTMIDAVLEQFRKMPALKLVRVNGINFMKKEAAWERDEFSRDKVYML